MNDIFFISFDESNSEQNWNRLLKLHPSAQRVHGINSISESHLECNRLAKTERFWTVDGDNWLLKSIPKEVIGTQELLVYMTVDPIDQYVCASGGIKSWRKDCFINTDMTKGDFSMHATNTIGCVGEILSIHKYDVTPYESWKHTFRQTVKTLSGIIPASSLYQNVARMEKHKTLNLWSYRGFIEGKDYVAKCNGDFNKINLINDYQWLKEKFNVSCN